MQLASDSVLNFYESLTRNLTRGGLVDVAPHPGFPWLDRTYKSVLGVVEMLGRMLVLRRIAATHPPTLQAKAQMNPGISRFDAILTHAFVCTGEFELIEMTALGHNRLQIQRITPSVFTGLPVPGEPNALKLRPPRRLRRRV